MHNQSQQDRFDQLIADYVEGRLAVEDARLLADALKDPEVLRRAASSILVHRLIPLCVRPAIDIEQVMRAIPSRPTDNRLVDNVMRLTGDMADVVAEANAQRDGRRGKAAPDQEAASPVSGSRLRIIRGRPSQSAGQESQPRSRWLVPLTMAASLTVVVGGWWFVQSRQPAGLGLKIVEVSGEANIQHSTRNTQHSSGERVVAGLELRQGDRLVVDKGGKMGLKYDAEETTIGLEGAATFEVKDGGKFVRLESGSFTCSAAPQSKPFRIQSPHALSTVMGTRFNIEVSGARTALAVLEGKVRFERDGQTLLVGSAQTAEASDLGLKIVHPAASTVSSANLIANPDFESGGTSWLYQGASRQAGEAYEGSYCGKVTGMKVGISQTVTGLKPNTTYVMCAWGRIDTPGEEAFIFAKCDGVTAQQGVFTTTTYTQKTLTIRTGPTSTSVDVGLWKYEGTGSAWVDNVEFSSVK